MIRLINIRWRFVVDPLFIKILWIIGVLLIFGIPLLGWIVGYSILGNELFNEVPIDIMIMLMLLGFFGIICLILVYHYHWKWQIALCRIQILIDDNMHNEAIGHIDKSLLVSPKEFDAAFGVLKSSVLIRVARFNEALNICNGIVRNHPDYAFGWYCKACAESRLGKNDDANISIKNAVKLLPKLLGCVTNDEDLVGLNPP